MPKLKLLWALLFLFASGDCGDGVNANGDDDEPKDQNEGEPEVSDLEAKFEPGYLELMPEHFYGDISDTFILLSL